MEMSGGSAVDSGWCGEARLLVFFGSDDEERALKMCGWR